MADLIVDGSLDDTNRDLKTILDEFNNCQKNASEDAKIWGQSDVASAMSAFANNWWVHRGKIQSTLTTLSNNVNQCCSTWSDADKQLADSLTTSSSNIQPPTAVGPRIPVGTTTLDPRLEAGTTDSPRISQQGASS